MSLLQKIFISFSLIAVSSFAENAPSEPKAAEPMAVSDYCFESLKKFPGPVDTAALKKACLQTQVLPSCYSVENRPIFHFDKKSQQISSQKILVFSLIHGDETPAGTVGRYWMEYLEKIDPRNSWRVVPLLNPDGVLRKTRTNANKVDVNRNFPTKDWEEKAVTAWKKEQASAPRRFPGPSSGSEPETKCALQHIEDFQPNFTVSIHTPLKVLDFDGPKVTFPRSDYLPWKSLGHFPGSLGRYLWFERQKPVLTMELRQDLPADMEVFTRLQNVIGLLVSQELEKKAARQVSGNL